MKISVKACRDPIVFIGDPQFQGQTKDRLNNPDVQATVDSAIRAALEQWLNKQSIGR